MFKKPSSGKKSGGLSQFGLIDIEADDGDDDLDLSDDDIDLEAELAALSGESAKPRPRKPAPVAPSNLDLMIAESLKDVPSDDDDASGDEDDPELLHELRQLSVDEDSPPDPPPRAARPAPPPPLSTDSSTVSVIQDRILNYTAAEKQAKEQGETSRARRFNRGLKTLNDLLKQAKSGRPVNDVDIPPPVPLKTSQPAPPPPQPDPVNPTPSEELVSPEPSEPSEPKEAPAPPPKTDELDPGKQEGLKNIMQRQHEFKAAALSSKNSGDKATALELLKVVKIFDTVIEAYKSGQEMDLSELPTVESITAGMRAQKEEEQIQNSAEPTPPPPPVPLPTDAATGLITASSVDEALRQRLAAFQKQEAKAKEEGNTSKARRMGRIVKQYQDAIKLNSAGKPIPADELPVPAGYAPLPGHNTDLGDDHPSPSSPPAARAAPPAPRIMTSAHDKQLLFLLKRQKEFKDAAIRAKKSGNIEQAKDYLRAAKGFDAVIEAAKGGLLVDLKSLPLAPADKTKLEKTFDIVQESDCTPLEPLSPTSGDVSLTGEDEDVLTKLSQQLTQQLKLCLTSRDHYREMGHIAEMNRFENLAKKVKQDLDVVVVAKSLGNSPPKFHYESKEFSVVQCNTDLNENDLELTIVRGIAYNVPNPKDIDTYVKFEFPYPQDAPISERTPLVKDSNSPVYNAVFPLTIHRKARPCLRLFKRHSIKFEVFSRGGWFSRDCPLGGATVKLAPLETHVTLHDAFPLMDGRRPAGGSLEVKLRVRTPIVQQQFEKTTHRWLVIEN